MKTSLSEVQLGPFLKAVLFSIPDENFKSFENKTVKLLPKETTWTSLEVRTHPTFLETSISKSGQLRTFAQKFLNIDFSLKILPLKDDELVVRNVKKWGVTDFVLERTCPEQHLNLSKSGFVSEEGHSGCKSQEIATRAFEGKCSLPNMV